MVPKDKITSCAPFIAHDSFMSLENKAIVVQFLHELWNTPNGDAVNESMASCDGDIFTSGTSLYCHQPGKHSPPPNRSVMASERFRRG